MSGYLAFQISFDPQCPAALVKTTSGEGLVELQLKIIQKVTVPNLVPSTVLSQSPFLRVRVKGSLAMVYTRAVEVKIGHW